jgi:serine/threonine protein kinase
MCPRDGDALETGTVDPLLGIVLDGRYRIDEMIGRGALGRVYRAQHVRLPRAYAVKIASEASSVHEHATQRLLHEAEVGAQLDHPNVVSVIDLGETEGGQPYLVMELAEGETLHAYLARVDRLRVDAALMLTRQIALGLQHAHARGFVHRDLAPSNVVIAANGRARILDFGLALALDGHDARVTGPGFAIGTPTYMSPEQAAGEPIDARADLYSLGVLFYHMLAGPTPLDEAAGGLAGLMVNAAVVELLHSMLKSRPAERIESATALVHAIDRILERGELLMWSGRRAVDPPAGEWADCPTARISPPRTQPTSTSVSRSRSR